jgi:hypothetical protein
MLPNSRSKKPACAGAVVPQTIAARPIAPAIVLILGMRGTNAHRGRKFLYENRRLTRLGKE